MINKTLPLLLCAALFLPSCAYQSHRAPVAESSTVSSSNSSASALPAGTSPGSDTSESSSEGSANGGWYLEEQGDKSTSSAAPSRSAVASLTQRALGEYSRGKYHRAIASAERALRISRQNPQAYLLLAKSYWRLGMSAQAEQFARQGLRFSDAGPASTVSALQALLVQISDR